MWGSVGYSSISGYGTELRLPANFSIQRRLVRSIKYTWLFSRVSEKRTQIHWKRSSPQSKTNLCACIIEELQSRIFTSWCPTQKSAKVYNSRTLDHTEFLQRQTKQLLWKWVMINERFQLTGWSPRTFYALHTNTQKRNRTHNYHHTKSICIK